MDELIAGMSVSYDVDFGRVGVTYLPGALLFFSFILVIGSFIIGSADAFSGALRRWIQKSTS